MRQRNDRFAKEPQNSQNVPKYSSVVKKAQNSPVMIAIPDEVRKVTADVATLLDVKEIHLAGTLVRKLVMKFLEINNDKFNEYPIKSMSFWIPDFKNPQLEGTRFSSVKDHNGVVVYYEIAGCSTDKKVKLFTCSDKQLSDFLVSRIRLHLQINDSICSVSGKMIAQSMEIKHLSKKMLHPLSEIQEKIDRNPCTIIAFHKETLRGSIPTTTLRASVQKRTLSKEQWDKCLPALLEMHHKELQARGNFYENGLEQYAIMKVVLEHYKNQKPLKNIQEIPVQITPVTQIEAISQATTVAQLPPEQQTEQKKSFRVPTFFMPRPPLIHTLDPLSQYQLGNDYYYGVNGLKQDFEKAVYWFALSAEQQFPLALHCLGMCYLHGDGLEKDEQKAFEYFYFSAWYGCVQSQTELACLLITGSGTDLNLDMGIGLMKWAASQGEAYALRCMANFCEQGEGMPMNKQDAHMYLQESKLAYDIWQKELTHTYPGFGM